MRGRADAVAAAVPLLTEHPSPVGDPGLYLCGVDRDVCKGDPLTQRRVQALLDVPFHSMGYTLEPFAEAVYRLYGARVHPRVLELWEDGLGFRWSASALTRPSSRSKSKSKSKSRTRTERGKGRGHRGGSKDPTKLRANLRKWVGEVGTGVVRTTVVRAGGWAAHATVLFFEPRGRTLTLLDPNGDYSFNLDILESKVRAQLLPASRIVDQIALDRYSFIRDSYLARRRNLVYNGNPPPEPDNTSPEGAPAPK